MVGLLDDFKAKNPAYADTPDDKLADGLYKKFYADKMSRDDFNAKAGISESLLSSVTRPIRELPGDIAGEFSKGREMARSGIQDIEKGGALNIAKGAGKAVLGGISEVASPISGTVKAFGSDPVRRAVPGKVGEALGTGVDIAGGFVGPGAAAKGLEEVGRMLPGLSKEVKLLMNEGVNLTPGHMGGRIVKSGEDALGSFPGFVRPAQQRMFDDFNRAVLNRSLKLVGEEMPKGVAAGRPMIQKAYDILDAKYRALLPRLQWTYDAKLSQDLQALRQPNVYMKEPEQKQFNAIINDIEERMTRPGVNADKLFKRIESELSTASRDMASGAPDSSEVQLSRQLTALNMRLRQSLERSNPQFAGELQELNKAYAYFKVAEGASIRRVAGEGVDPGIFTPADMLREIKASVSDGIYARGQGPMQDLADAAQKVLPQVLRNSGTVDRGIWAALMGGGAAIDERAAIALGAASAPYLKPVQAGINAAVRGTPAAGTRALDALSRSGPFAGAAELLEQLQPDQ